MINKATLVGRLGKDPESAATGDGTAVSNFSIATDESYKNKSGEKVQNTEWHRIVAFGALADICNKYLEKGKLVYVEGKIQTRAWEDKEGVKKYTTSIIASVMKMLDGKKDEATTTAPEDVPF